MPKSLEGVAPVYLTWGTLGDILAPNFPKRELLIFDHLFVIGLDHFLTSLPTHYRASLEWLIEKDVVRVFQRIERDEPAWRFVRSALTELDMFDMLSKNEATEASRRNRSVQDERALHYYSFHNNLVRATAASLSDRPGIDAVSLIPAQFFRSAIGDDSTNIQQSVRVVIHNLPFLEQDTPLEDILAFKSEEETVSKLSSLRRWMKRTAVSFDRPDDLQRYMKIQKMQYSLCTVEALFTVAAELVEDVAKFRLKNLVQKSFSIFTQSSKMLEQEMKAPGREVAFFIHANRRFAPTGVGNGKRSR
jgi:hypothetical protein